MQKIKIAIDGPAASGKSTTAKLIADKLGYLYVDTGAMYRALTLAIIKSGVSISDQSAIRTLAQNTQIELKKVNSESHTFLNNRDVSQEIRLPEINQIISQISIFPDIRKLMVEKQRYLATQGGVVMDGRDIGTIVLPEAEVKIFMLADLDKRAERRYKELKQKGVNSDLDQIKNEIRNRDQIDSTRSTSPLKPANDAVIIDTSEMTIEEQTKECLKIIKKYFK